MNQENEFEKFYSERLLPLLSDLKIKSNQSGWAMVLVVVFSMLAFLILFTDSLWSEKKYIIFWFLILMSFGGFLIYKFSKKADAYKDEYKASVVRRIIKYVAPRIDYKPHAFIDEADYVKSGLMRRHHDVYKGANGMVGLVKNHFQCSDIYTGVDLVPGQQQTIFEGLFFVIKINNQFTGGTYVFTKQQEEIENTTYLEPYKLRPLPTVSKLDFRGQEFDTYFSAYTTEISQAAYILSPFLRSQMVQLRKLTGRDLSISFVAGNCYIALPNQENSLAGIPPIFSEDFKSEVFEEYKKIHLIVNTVNLIDISNLI